MTITQVMKHGNPRWRVDLGTIGGKRRVKFFKLKVDAEKEVNRQKELKQKCGDLWLGLPPSELATVQRILVEMKQKGFTLLQVWDAFKDHQFKPKSGKALSVVIGEYITSRRTAKRRENYLTTLENVLTKFASGREQQDIADVTTADVEAWLAARDEPPSSRLSTITRLSGLFTFSRKRELIDRNPCDGIDRPFVDTGIPKILTLEQCKIAMLFGKKHKRFLPYLTLALFAGIRPEEIDRLTWGDVDKKRGLVRIDAAAAKTRDRRLVHLSPNAVAWLKRGGDLPLPNITKRRYLRKLRAELGFVDWPKDILRHTAASMMLARDRDAGKVALELGNSVAILLKHYKELVTESDAQKFFSILP